VTQERQAEAPSGPVLLAHGAGGRASAELVRGLFAPAFDNPFLRPLSDAAVLPPLPPGRPALTTDGFVVDPWQFPGGDLGYLSVCGTVNDLAVSGAVPLWLTWSLILEEGLDMAILRQVVASAARASREAGVHLVAGDTKVVPRGKGDKVFATTSGLGVVPPDIDVGGEVVQIAAGEARTCALLKTGAVRCWGISWVDPDLDPIGDDPGDMPPPDVLVTGTFTQIHAAKHEACVVRDDGTVACWTGDMIPHERPFGGVVVELSGYICARMNDGAARCLGYNDYGQKGYGHTKYVGDPVQAGDIPVGGLVTRIAPGGAHTCAIVEGGAVRCWGANFCGGLGYGHTMDLGDMPGELPTPDVPLGGPAIDVALAFGYGCALLAGDEVRCWGCGNEGNLGYGNYQDIGDAPGEMPPPVVPVF